MAINTQNHELISDILSSNIITESLFFNENCLKTINEYLLEFPLLDHALRLMPKLASDYFQKIFEINGSEIDYGRVRERLGEMFILNSLKDIEQAIRIAFENNQNSMTQQIIVDELNRLKKIGGLIARSRQKVFFDDIKDYMSRNQEIDFKTFAKNQINYAQSRYDVVTLAKKRPGNLLQFYQRLLPQNRQLTFFPLGSSTEIPNSTRYEKFKTYIQETLSNKKELEGVLDSKDGVFLYHPILGKNLPLTQLYLNLWAHTDKNIVIEALPYYMKCFKDLENFDFNSSSIEDFTEKLIEFSWLGPHMYLLDRGNAQFVLDMMSYLLRKHNLSMGPVRFEMTFADCIALSVPLSRYRELFPKIVEHLPVKSTL